MTMMGSSKSLFAAAMLAALCTGASAQTGRNYDVKTLNFDMWCQETQHWDPDRCDKRTPEDEKVFESYRTNIEQYEIPHLQEQQRDLSVDRDLLQRDPVDKPLTQDPQAQSQSPTEQPAHPTP